MVVMISVIYVLVMGNWKIVSNIYIIVLREGYIYNLWILKILFNFLLYFFVRNK